MVIRKLYRYCREDGGVTDTLEIPADVDFTERVRLVADEGKLLTQDGENLYPAKDADSADGWYEVDAPKEALDEVSDTEE